MTVKTAGDYAGDLLPGDAWELLEREPAATVIDVRTDAEWAYVGVPDLEPLDRQLHYIAWQVFPDMARNPRFVEELEEKGFDKEQPLLFLCRSGQRSRSAAIEMTARGFSRCYNIAEGFEGDRDDARHRGTRGGWKQAGLPWTQG